MTNTRQDIDDLFSMFHDFEIVDIALESKVLTLTIMVPWGQLWQDDNFRIIFRFDGCEYIRSTYSKRVSDKLMQMVVPRTIDIVTDNIEEIKRQELNIQRHNFTEPNLYKLYCTSFADGVEFSILELTASNFVIFNMNNESISLAQMKTWAKEWWTSIEQMWEKQKKAKDAESF